MDGAFLGCAESVVWSVFKEPLKISYHQLKRFWELRTMTAGVEEHLIENFRSKIFRESLFLNFPFCFLLAAAAFQTIIQHCHTYVFPIKLMYSKKVTKFFEIFTLLLTGTT